MDEKLRRKVKRGDIGSYSWALLIYYLLMNVCVFAAMMIQVVIDSLGSMASGEFSAMGQTDPEAMMGNGWGYLVASIFGVLFIRLWKGKEFWQGMWKTEKVMKPGGILRLACLFVSGQALFQVCATIQEAVLNLFGLSVLESMELATANTDTLSMFLYTALAAPVVEEIIFRGLIMRGLEKYGKHFAILISSILFGLFHGNIVQSPYAFVVGLVLGYTAMEHNILWAMVLHMVNNLVLGDTLPRLTQWMGQTGSGLVLWGVILVCTVAAVVTLVRRRKEVADYLRREQMNWENWWAFSTAPGFLVLFLVMELSALSMLFL